VALPTLGATPKPPPVDPASRATLKAIRNRPSHKNLPRTEQWRQVRTARAITMPPRALAVVKAVAHRHGVELDALLGGRVIGGIVRARQEAMHALFMLGTFSTTQIGGFIGGRDHTSAIHGIRAHRERIQPDLDAWSTLGKSEAA
jgi:chromosomal replication initiation ATPase DnaA